MAIDLEVIRGEKQEPCMYCGKPEHAVPLACPRISHVTVYADAGCIDVYFRGDEPDPDPSVAA